MAIELLDIRSVPEARRTTALTDAISRSFAPCECGYDAEDRAVDVSFRKVSLGPVTVVEFSGVGTQWAERRREHLGRSPSDAYLLYVPRRSRIRVRQSGRDASFTGAEVGFVGTRSEFSGEIAGRGGERHRSMHFVVPGPLLRSRIPAADGLRGGAARVGPVFERILVENGRALLDAATIDDAALARSLGDVLLETLTAVSAYALERIEPRPFPRSAAERAFERVRRFVLANLADPELGIASIADALGVSERYVHAAFEGSGKTPMRWIKQRRLLEARKAILGATGDRSLTEIALDWGFADPSHFARSYKQAFGVAPSTERRGREPIGRKVLSGRR